MKTNKMIVLAALTAAHVASAETQLPYLGPENMDCKVNTPGDEFKMKDSGYFTSEDCKVIYVKPPAIGLIQTHSAIYHGRTYLCKVLDGMRKNLERFYENNQKIIDEKVLVKNIESLQRIEEKLRDLTENNVEAVATLSANLDWNNLVQAYSTQNPEKVVRRMPIAFGIFSTQVISDQSDNFSGKLYDHAIKKLRVYGAELTEDYFTDNQSLPDVFKNIKSDEDSVQILMGDALGLSMELNLTGACALKEQSANQNPSSYIAGTYTYVYPVQTKTLLKIDLDEPKLENQIFEIVKKNGGQIDSSHLATITTDMFSIEINGGAFPNDGVGKKQKEEFLDILRSETLESVLQRISSKVDFVVGSSKFTENEQRASTTCHRKWFKKRCHTTVYTVPIEKINWEKVRSQLDQLISNSTGGVHEYKSFYMMGSSAIVPHNKE